MEVLSFSVEIVLPVSGDNASQDKNRKENGRGKCIKERI